MSNPLKDLINSDQLETVLPDLSEKQLYVLSKAAIATFRSHRKLKKETYWPRKCIVRHNFDDDESQRENDHQGVGRHEFDELTKKVDELLIELHALKIRMDAQERRWWMS